jgi:methyl-accepting chemotaxis protein
VAAISSKSGSILIKIAGVSSIFLLISSVILTILSIYYIESISRQTAVTVATSKIDGDLHSFHDMINESYGTLRLAEGSLAGEDGQSLEGRFDLIDKLSGDLGIVATIFMKDGDDFRRITTSITDGEGRRVVGTMLGSASAAFGPVSRGERYIGNAKILGNDYIAGYEPVFAPSGAEVIGILFVGLEMSDVNAVILRGSREGIVVIIIVSVSLLIVSSILTVIVFRRIIVLPVRKIVTVLQHISEGTLTEKLDIRNRDEIGNMARFMNLMSDSMRHLIVLIRDQSQRLQAIGGNLASSMNETAAAIHEISSNTESIKTQVTNQAGSVTQTTASMGEITGDINTLNGLIREQTDDIALSSSAIEEMLANISSVTGTLSSNTKNVQELSVAAENGRASLFEVSQNIQEIAKNSEGLKDINSVIDGIASQTNLLSMNAAIEAAHAGESGRGFAVVASEIRKLAESSNQQVKTVSEVLKKIQASIRKISESTDDVMRKFETIDAEIRTVTDQEENVRAAMEEQNAGSKQILEAINGLQTKNSSVKEGASRMLSRSDLVIDESRKLENITAEINTGMDEMAVGTREINTAVQNVNQISVENRENIEALIGEVLKFKV